MIGLIDDLIPKMLKLDRDKKYELKEHKEKRSLDSNSYAWVLITKIANELRKSKEEVYLDMLKDYGQSEYISVQADVDVKGYLKYYEVFGESSVKGKSFKHYKVYKGSSEFDSKEMSIFIDGIIQDCQSIGIETMTPQELNLLKERWNNEL